MMTRNYIFMDGVRKKRKGKKFNVKLNISFMKLSQTFTLLCCDKPDSSA